MIDRVIVAAASCVAVAAKTHESLEDKQVISGHHPLIHRVT